MPASLPGWRHHPLLVVVLPVADENSPAAARAEMVDGGRIARGRLRGDCELRRPDRLVEALKPVEYTRMKGNMRSAATAGASS